METKQIIGIILFILFLVLLGYLLYRLIQNYRATNRGEPWLIKDTKIARTPKIIPAYMLPASNDSRYGMEFSYTFWIYITDWVYKKNEEKHIFHKGNNSMNPLIQSPGVWLAPDDNKMIIKMNTFSNIDQECVVDNLPIAKWFHVGIILIGHSLDVYINGRLKKRCVLDSVPRLNHGDLYINLDNGFDGFLSRFRYFNYALPFWKFEQLFNQGPSDRPCEGTDLPTPPYLASDYWMQR
jgi:hypothetical protein